MFTRKVSVTNHPCGAGEPGSQCNAYQATNAILSLGAKCRWAVFTIAFSSILEAVQDANLYFARRHKQHSTQ